MPSFLVFLSCLERTAILARVIALLRSSFCCFAEMDNWRLHFGPWHLAYKVKQRLEEKKDNIGFGIVRCFEVTFFNFLLSNLKISFDTSLDCTEATEKQSIHFF